MKIGVVSDTHNNLGNVREIVRLFNAAGVDRVVHTGDITKAKTLDVLAGLDAPLYGVYGNNDVERESLDARAARYGFVFRDPPLELDWASRRIVVVHDPRDLGQLGVDGHDLALHGHTHMARCEHQQGLLVFNPGECAGHMKGYNAVGVVDLGTLKTTLLKF
ncbi:MAG: YfcE family phosphodiesterase [Gammaproteobacteria bacterium]|nr:YfcE family phosphodiesterase [Gammaproteobacteria bacterium]MDE0442158.1 YfcE family phosphodiesterase [Gammaproteobacteria bacterium]